MANKWRVKYEGKVLGHYTGHNPAEAVQKAMAKYIEVGISNFYPNSAFTICRAGSRDAEEFLIAV